MQQQYTDALCRKNLMDQVEISPNPVSRVKPAFSKRGAIPVILPIDSRAARACVLSFVTTGETSHERSAAVEAMSNRVELLRDRTGVQLEEELFGHMAILEALWLRYATEATRAEKAENSAIYCKLALLCQTSYTRTALAIESLRAQRQQKPLKAISDD